MKLDNVKHLGDGTYVSVGMGGIWITANHHDPDEATDKVFLDEYVSRNLITWLRKILEEDF